MAARARADHQLLLFLLAPQQASGREDDEPRKRVYDPMKPAEQDQTGDNQDGG